MVQVNSNNTKVMQRCERFPGVFVNMGQNITHYYELVVKCKSVIITKMVMKLIITVIIPITIMMII